MNPFCVAECHYEFSDLSSGNLIDSGDFTILPVFSKLKTYFFNRTETNEGQRLNRFDIKCQTQKARFCYTKSKEVERSSLITLNYELDEEQKKLMDAARGEIIELIRTNLLINQDLNESNLNIARINNSFSVKNLSEHSFSLYSKILNLNNSIKNLENLWRAKKVSEMQKGIAEIKPVAQEINKSENLLRKNVSSSIYLYNSLIDNITNVRLILKEISKFPLTNLFCDKFKGEILRFNAFIEAFANESNLDKKEENTKNVSSEIIAFYQEVKDESGEICSFETPVLEKNFTKISEVYIEKVIPEISLEESTPMCCFYGKCEKCCDENCSDKNYPIIFLHGHSVNKALPADYSLDALVKIKDELSKDGYINVGAMITSTTEEKPGLWGRVNAPVAITASYFFDVYRTETGEEIIVPSKTGSIDTYAIRLRDIIETVKHRTNKDKVIIMAHSMGGLVTRRYVQVFGDSDIEKVIFITIPNHGIDGKVEDSCPILGEKSTCRDMSKEGIFINKLNNAPQPAFPITNIIGVGCNMGSETGDGIVKNSSQFLSYATNYYINGKCDEFSLDFLHGTIVNPQQYPEVYEIIQNALNITQP